MIDKKLLHRAELMAEQYVRPQTMLGIEEEFTAKEDFVAGYLAASDNVTFLVEQMKHILELAKANDEYYSQAIARYVLNRIKL